MLTLQIPKLKLDYDFKLKGFRLSLSEIEQATKTHKLILPLKSDKLTQVFISKGRVKKAKLCWAFGDNLILSIPDSKEVVKKGRREVFGQFPDLGLIWYAQEDS